MENRIGSTIVEFMATEGNDIPIPEEERLRSQEKFVRGRTQSCYPPGEARLDVAWRAVPGNLFCGCRRLP